MDAGLRRDRSRHAKRVRRGSCAGWVPSLGVLTRDEMRAGNEQIDASAEKAGRDPGSIRRIINLQGLIGEGKTLAQVKAANPTLGYRSQYGADSGPWTTDMFVEVIYNELASKKGKK